MGSFFTSATLEYGDIDVDCLSFVISLSSGVHHCAADKTNESGFCLASDVMDRLLRRTGGNLAVMHLDVLCTVQELPGDAGLQISPVYAPNPGKGAAAAADGFPSVKLFHIEVSLITRMS